jgi:sialate O-acetylesterase
MSPRALLLPVLVLTAVISLPANARALKTHRIFSSNMVIQRDKPIVVWGWADAGDKVAVQFGTEKAEAVAAGEVGRWEVKFPAHPADTAARTLTVSSGDETLRLDNVVIGDVWVMNGQSNMALGLDKVNDGDFEIAQADMPLLRAFRITPNEAYELQTDLPDAAVEGWNVCTRETAGGISAIGYAFASRVQRATGIPIGVIDNARGGASIESLVPRHKFEDHPLAARYADSVEKRRKEFDWDAAVNNLAVQWERQVERDRKKGVAEDKLPPKPALVRESLKSWSIPGKSPSDAASCYNGMFGAFKGLNIKGVLFHQGYNNRFDCRPKRYRVLLKLMVEGWREDFNDPALPVGVIAGCGSDSDVQTPENFEAMTVAEPAYLREAQRLGLGDVGDPAHTVFIPDYDTRIPGLHPKKKLAYGFRAARWALSTVYGFGDKVEWGSGSLLSAQAEGDVMLLSFDRKVMPDDHSRVLEGFSIADASGKFYLAHAAYPNVAGKVSDFTKVYVWSPLVKEPVAVRYAWASGGPMGNLKVDGNEWLPLPSFRTDTWDYPESEDPAEQIMDGAKRKALTLDANERLEHRKQEEARQAVEILARLKTLGSQPAKGK